MFSGFSLFQDSPFTRVSYIFLTLFLAVIALLVRDAVKQLKQIKKRSFKLILALVILTYFYGYYLCYPGLMVIDDALAARAIFAGEPYTWLSLSYAFLLAAGYVLFGKVGFIPVLSILLMGYLLVRATRLICEARLSEKWRWICFGLMCALSLNPLIQGLLIFHSRDIIFSLALTFVGLLLFEKSKWLKREIILLSALIVYLSDLRAEAKLYLGLVPLFFFYAKHWNLKQAGLNILSMICFGLLYLFYIPYHLNAHSMSIGYKVTTWVMPLSQIYHDLGVQKIDQEITKKINAVLDVEKLEKHFSSVDIDAYHFGAFNQNTTEAEWAEFKKAALSLFWAHPDIYLKNRVHLFVNMLNIDHETFIYYDDFHGKNETSLEIRSHLNLPEGDYALKGMAETYYNFLGWWGRSRHVLIQVFNSLLVPLLFSLFCLSYVKSRPEVFCFSLLALARAPVMFLLAPSSYTRYLFALLLFFVFCLPLLISRIKSQDSIADRAVQ